MSISIIMLSFNQSEYLGAAMRSVLEQDSVDLELIVIDPGSTDGSREFAERLAGVDSRITLLFEPDDGPAHGLNKGFKKAKNEIVSYLNSDDIYLNSTLKKVEHEFQANPEVDVIYGHGLILDERKEIKLNFGYSDELTNFKLMSNSVRIMQQSTFFRRESLVKSQLEFKNDNSTCWDFEFIVDAFLAGLEIKRLEDIFGVLRIHSRSITGMNLLFNKYESDKKRILDNAMKEVGKTISTINTIFNFGYRILRRVRVSVLRMRFNKKIKEFTKNAPSGFVE